VRVAATLRARKRTATGAARIRLRRSAGACVTGASALEARARTHRRGSRKPHTAVTRSHYCSKGPQEGRGADFAFAGGLGRFHVPGAFVLRRPSPGARPAERRVRQPAYPSGRTGGCRGCLFAVACPPRGTGGKGPQGAAFAAALALLACRRVYGHGRRRSGERPAGVTRPRTGPQPTANGATLRPRFRRVLFFAGDWGQRPPGAATCAACLPCSATGAAARETRRAGSG
jgi:hypothetical protein